MDGKSLSLLLHLLSITRAFKSSKPVDKDLGSGINTFISLVIASSSLEKVYVYLSKFHISSKTNERKKEKSITLIGIAVVLRISTRLRSLVC